MIDMNQAIRSKERVILSLKTRGPSLPVQVARDVGFSSIFASAFLSELKAEGLIKISDMKVGGSPLYYLPEHELQLERFSSYLNQREREAFDLLRREKVLKDKDQNPVVRVALSMLKDFAIPLKVNLAEGHVLYWKYFAISDLEASDIIENSFMPKKSTEEKKEDLKIENKEIEENMLKKDEAVQEVEKEKKKEHEEISKTKKTKGKRLKNDAAESEFLEKAKNHLKKRKIEIVSILYEKKKELCAKVKTEGHFGKQEYYMLAKDKKSINDNDLALVLPKAQQEKLPALVISWGDLNKKAQEYLDSWRNLIKFEKIS